MSISKIRNLLKMGVVGYGQGNFWKILGFPKFETVNSHSIYEVVTIWNVSRHTIHITKALEAIDVSTVILHIRGGKTL